MLASVQGSFRTLALALAVLVCLTACGGEDDVSSADAPVESVGSDDGTGDVTADGTVPDEDTTSLPPGDASDLVVPLDYLQGEWCNSDGESWVFDGETARFGENGEFFGELPIALALAAGSERVLISQSDDEFVLDLQTRELTFTRGSC